MEYSVSSVSYSFENTFSAEVIIESCDLDSQCCRSLMKSALNPFPVCHFLLDNMMDGPFYSLFHLLCCSKLYFQGAFTWNIHFCVTWLFIRQEPQMRQGIQEGGERSINPTNSVLYLTPAEVTLYLPLLTLLMTHQGGVMRLINIFGICQ